VKSTPYAPSAAAALAPLLESIGREIDERVSRLAEVEARIEELHASPFYSEEMHGLVAEAAAHRAALRQCKNELESLGCSVVGTMPLTVRIPTRVGEERQSLVWQQGDAERD
jgi:hypothetical protein